MEVLLFGKILLWVSAAVTALIGLFSLLGVGLRDRRFVVASRYGLYALFVLLLGVSACLVHGFITGTYNNEYIYDYSEKELFVGFKIAGLWAGLDGSLIFWTLILSAASAVVAFQHRWSGRHPSGRRMEPWVYIVLSVLIGFFVALCLQQDAFSTMDLEQRLFLADRSQIPIDSDASLLDGHGLNPQLVNYWFVIHPPNLYLGLVLFAVPFAFGIAALITGELGGYWIRVCRRWAMAAWLFLTCGIILGGLWAYRQLGWGGYWAWDPVENASFLPWCTATAFLHSIMIQERRDMLKWWNAFLVILTFFLTVEATYMTRSGEISSIHSFAGGGSIGAWFRIFKFAIAGVGGFLLFYRIRELRGSNRLESLMSREAVFFFNNLVLVAIALATWFLSWWPKNSVAYLGAEKAVGVPFYNLVMTPLFVMLFFLTAIGPGLGWVRSSWASVRKNLLGPGLFALLVAGLFYLVLLLQGRIGSAREVLIPKPVADAIWGKDTEDLYWASGLYPTGIFVFLCTWIVAVVAFEGYRAVRGRMRTRGVDLLAASVDVVTRNNRRYGGYVVHIGIAMLTFGIVMSSMFREKRRFQLEIGQSGRIGPYSITPVKANRHFSQLDRAVDDIRSGQRDLAEIEPGLPYLRDEVLFEVRLAGEATSASRRAHAEAERPEERAAGESGARASAGEVVCELRPERRFYPKQNQWINEVSIHRMLLGDLYMYYEFRDERDRVHLTVFLNPLMVLIWVGWFIMIGGGLFAALPMGPRRLGLSD